MGIKSFKLEHKKAFRFKPDHDFERVLDQSLEGVLVTGAVMILLGHQISTATLDNVLSHVFRHPDRKRNYAPDLECARCGQKFEAKWKSCDAYFYVGPDLLERYAAENAVIVFTFPSRIVAVKARNLWTKRAEAILGFNRWKEPYLDFYGVHNVPVLLELKRRSPCLIR